jgi:hypothetical protein
MTATQRTFYGIVVAACIPVAVLSCASRRGPATDRPEQLRIVSLQAEFHTQDDDKDADNGISETFTYNTRVIGENRSYQKQVTFRDNSQSAGQLFTLDEDDQFPLSEIGAVSTATSWTTTTAGTWLFVSRRGTTGGPSILSLRRSARLAMGSPVKVRSRCARVRKVASVHPPAPVSSDS